VRSENGPKKYIIDGQGSDAEPHRGFYVHSGEGEYSVVDAGDEETGFLPQTFRIGMTRSDWVRDAGVIDIGYHHTERRLAVGPNQVQE